LQSLVYHYLISNLKNSVSKFKFVLTCIFRIEIRKYLDLSYFTQNSKISKFYFFVFGFKTRRRAKQQFRKFGVNESLVQIAFSKLLHFCDRVCVCACVCVPVCVWLWIGVIERQRESGRNFFYSHAYLFPIIWFQRDIDSWLWTMDNIGSYRVYHTECVTYLD